MSEPTEGIVARIAAELRREFGPDWRAVAARNQDLAFLSAACVGYRMALEDQRASFVAQLLEVTREVGRQEVAAEANADLSHAAPPAASNAATGTTGRRCAPRNG
jgi:hypothetical protein